MLPLTFVDLSNVHFTTEANKIVTKQPLSSPKERSTSQAAPSAGSKVFQLSEKQATVNW